MAMSGGRTHSLISRYSLAGIPYRQHKAHLVVHADMQVVEKICCI